MAGVSNEHQAPSLDAAAPYMHFPCPNGGPPPWQWVCSEQPLHSPLARGGGKVLATFPLLSMMRPCHSDFRAVHDWGVRQAGVCHLFLHGDYWQRCALSCRDPHAVLSRQGQ